MRKPCRIVVGVLMLLLACFPVDSGARDFPALVAKTAAQSGVPAELALRVTKVESDFRPDVVSGAGAIGLMQVKPVVVRDLVRTGLIQRGEVSIVDLFDPETNIGVACAYLRLLADHYFSDAGALRWVWAIAAYHDGPTAVRALRLSSPRRSELAALGNLLRSESARQYLWRVASAAQPAMSDISGEL